LIVFALWTLALLLDITTSAGLEAAETDPVYHILLEVTGVCQNSKPVVLLLWHASIKLRRCSPDNQLAAKATWQHQ